MILVIITGTYTYYASRQAQAAIDAANAATGAVKVASDTLSEAQRENAEQGRIAEIDREESRARFTASTDQYNRSLQTTIDNFHRDERAYLAESKEGTEGPSLFITPHLSGKAQVSWNWRFFNYGKSPAEKVRARMEISLDGTNFTRTYNAFGVVTTQDGDFSTQPPTHETYSTVFSQPMDTATAQKIVTEKNRITIRIRLIYSDFTHVTHETGICYRSTPHGAIIYCENDNYMK